MATLKDKAVASRLSTLSRTYVVVSGFDKNPIDEPLLKKIRVHLSKLSRIPLHTRVFAGHKQNVIVSVLDSKKLRLALIHCKRK